MYTSIYIYVSPLTKIKMPAEVLRIDKEVPPNQTSMNKTKVIITIATVTLIITTERTITAIAGCVAMGK